MKSVNSKNSEHDSALQLLAQIAQAGLSRTFLLIGPDSLSKTEWVRTFASRKKTPLIEIPCGTAADRRLEELAFAQETAGLLLLKDVELLDLGAQRILLHLLERGSQVCFAQTGTKLAERVKDGSFLPELWAVLSAWTFAFPPLTARQEDFPELLENEFARWSARSGIQVAFEESALQKYLRFAVSMEAVWRGDLRDLRGSVSRMAALAVLKHGGSTQHEEGMREEGMREEGMREEGMREGGMREGGMREGVISAEIVHGELQYLRGLWAGEPPVIRESAGEQASETARKILGEERWDGLDRFAKAQLADVLLVCRQAQSLSEAGRVLFSSSRLEKSTTNDTDRLRKYLLKFGITWNEIQNAQTELTGS